MFIDILLVTIFLLTFILGIIKTLFVFLKSFFSFLTTNLLKTKINGISFGILKTIHLENKKIFLSNITIPFIKKTNFSFFFMLYNLIDFIFLFIGLYIVFSVISFFIIKKIKKNKTISLIDHVGGGSIGLVFGGAITVFSAIAITFITTIYNPTIALNLIHESYILKLLMVDNFFNIQYITSFFK